MFTWPHARVAIGNPSDVASAITHQPEVIIIISEFLFLLSLKDCHLIISINTIELIFSSSLERCPYFQGLLITVYVDNTIDTVGSVLGRYGQVSPDY